MTGSSVKRAIAKSALWKIIGVVALVGVSWAAGVPAVQIGKVTIGYHILTLVLYFFHERMWDRTQWGRVNKPDPGVKPGDETKAVPNDRCGGSCRSGGSREAQLFSKS